MDELTFEECNRRISIQEVLEDAGYRFNRRDGMRWPSYSRVDSDGRRIHGDKFVVCANGMACFQPPETKRYNVISFIAEHPNLFPEGGAGKDPYAVVNEVCHRLLNAPMEERPKWRTLAPRKETKPFNMSDYQCENWMRNDYETQRRFFPYFIPRAITRQTQRAFAGQYCLTTLRDKPGARQNLSFPMRIPGLAKIVGLEQRGVPDEHGKNSYKGMAKGTNATQGVWMGSPKLGINVSTNLDKAKHVFWFESALDAMAFYQLRTEPLKRQIAEYQKQYKDDPSVHDTLAYLKEEVGKYDNAVYVSTGGSPSLQQLKGVLSKTEKADQHVCFDNDKAGHVFAVDLLLTRAGRNFQTTLLDNGQLQVIDQTEKPGKKYTLNLEPFEFDRIAHVLGVGNPDMKDYVESMSNPKDQRSGDYDLLPTRSLVLSYYSKIFTLSEQYHNGELLQGIPKEQEPEVLGRYKMVMNELQTRFRDTLKSDLEAYQHHKSGIDIEVPPSGYKDWNEVTMDKHQYDEQDTISTVGEDGEVITDEVNQDHEETVKRDDDDEETTKRHSRR